MKWMMSTIADINCNFAKLSLENWMTCFTLHVIGRFIEISNPRYMAFLLFA